MGHEAHWGRDTETALQTINDPGCCYSMYMAIPNDNNADWYLGNVKLNCDKCCNAIRLASAPKYTRLLTDQSEYE